VAHHTLSLLDVRHKAYNKHPNKHKTDTQTKMQTGGHDANKNMSFAQAYAQGMLAVAPQMRAQYQHSLHTATRPESASLTSEKKGMQ
jgi:hypothetical protein